MNQHVGQTIRYWRKQRKLTLQQLAGERLTKGMLSLIENGKAQPSMESLTYIAEQLQVSVGQLLGGRNEETLLRKVEQHVYAKEWQDVLRLAETVDDVTSYEVAKIYYYAGKVLLRNGDNPAVWNERAIDYFAQLQLYNHWGKAMSLRAGYEFSQHHYAAAIETVRDIKAMLAEKYQHVDNVTWLEINYLEIATISTSLTEEALAQSVEKALALIEWSKRENVYSQMADIYRLIAAFYLLMEKEADYLHYNERAIKFAEATDDATRLEYSQFLHILYLNEYRCNHDAALAECDRIEPHIKERDLLMMERANAYAALGRYEEAFRLLEQINLTVLDQVHHPVDIGWQTRVYRAFVECHLARGERNEALRYWHEAHKRLAPIGFAPFDEQLQLLRDKIGE